MRPRTRIALLPVLTLLVASLCLGAETYVKECLIALDADPVGSSTGEFSAHIRSELQRWAAVIKTAGIVAE